MNAMVSLLAGGAHPIYDRSYDPSPKEEDNYGSQPRPPLPRRRKLGLALASLGLFILIAGAAAALLAPPPEYPEFTKIEKLAADRDDYRRVFRTYEPGDRVTLVGEITFSYTHGTEFNCSFCYNLDEKGTFYSNRSMGEYGETVVVECVVMEGYSGNIGEDFPQEYLFATKRLPLPARTSPCLIGGAALFLAGAALMTGGAAVLLRRPPTPGPSPPEAPRN